MKIKYLIPFIGLFYIYRDIPHEEYQRSYKPLQGNEAFVTMLISACSTILTMVAATVLITS